MEINRQQLAFDYFSEGYNCAEAVALAFADVFKMDKESIIKMSVAFGGGFGRTRNLCGAVSAMGLVIGFLHDINGDAQEDKTAVYKQIQDVVEQFKERNGSDNCGVLLKNVKNLSQGYVPTIRNSEFYTGRPCVKFVLDSVEILENYFKL